MVTLQSFCTTCSKDGHCAMKDPSARAHGKGSVSLEGKSVTREKQDEVREQNFQWGKHTGVSY